jgi:hypothetical protein
VGSGNGLFKPTGASGPFAGRSAMFGILAALGRGAFPRTFRANMGFAFPFLLRRAPFGFLALSLGAIAAVLARAIVFGGAGFAQRNGDGLLAAFDFAALAGRTGLEFAMFEFMHHATFGAALT